ncbi:hypothetical protein UA45_20810 [Morganella morganii]|uniref:Uncharacterized protein n=1 Tax=Morganella morganii TaxID=582 RepID=A0A0D8L487_MORMO|nr:hypothetical protein UA45_20810 [Morganella morganii]
MKQRRFLIKEINDEKLPALALLATLLAGSAGSVFAANGGFEGPGATAAATTTTTSQTAVSAARMPVK